MTEEASIKKTLIEQILEGMFTRIEGEREFDTRTIEKLRCLAEGDKLREVQQVILALTPESEESHENS